MAFLEGRTLAQKIAAPRWISTKRSVAGSPIPHTTFHPTDSDLC